MELIADGLLIVGAMAAAFYCWVLSVRVKGLKDLDTGVGGAIASLSAQVDEMRTALKAAQSVTGASVSDLQSTTKRAEKVARRLEEFLDELDDMGLTGTAANADPDDQTESQDKSKSATVSELSEKRQQKAGQKEQQVKKPEALTAAEQLQDDIRQRLSGRGSGGDEDDFVKALQTVLAAATK